jgi:predicted transcriptional regulator YdeE
MMKVNLESIRLVGLRLGKYTTNVAGESSRDCGMLWQKFEQEGILQRIVGKVSNNIYAVYYGYTGREADTQFEYFIGCHVHDKEPVPDGLEVLLIPKQSYKIITAQGKMPQCIADAWNQIWEQSYNRAFGYDFEVYGERSQNWEDAVVEIFLSV